MKWWHHTKGNENEVLLPLLIGKGCEVCVICISVNRNTLLRQRKNWISVNLEQLIPSKSRLFSSINFCQSDPSFLLYAQVRNEEKIPGLSAGLCNLAGNNCKAPSQSMAESPSLHQDWLEAVQLLTTLVPAPEKLIGRKSPK